jgi:3-hydroxyacyl-[acyl-carrier-protein] dehydratase
MPQTLCYEQIAAALLEGPPLVMLDRLELDAEAGSATGTKAVSMAEPFFQGHFPGAPIMPGVLQVGAMVQAASLLASKGESVNVRLVLLERVKFRKPVMPGDVLTVEVTAGDAAEGGARRFEGKTICGGDTTCSARFALAAEPVGTPAEGTVPEGEPKETLDTMGIAKIIPHRPPFLLVDAADVHDGWMMGYKNVSGGDALLVGAKCASFFEYLMVEAAAQTACAEALSAPESQGKLGYFMSIDKAEFFRQASPGDRLEMQVAMNMRGRFGTAEATGRVAGEVVFQAAMKFALVDREREEV